MHAVEDDLLIFLDQVAGIAIHADLMKPDGTIVMRATSKEPLFASKFTTGDWNHLASKCWVKYALPKSVMKVLERGSGFGVT